MKISDIIKNLKNFAAPVYQENYDNCGLLTGNENWNCTGVLCTLDTTEGIINEAIKRNCNLVVSHHPIIFSGLKKINGNNYVEKTVIAAIKNDIAIYAIHTNLDNILKGVNNKIADKLGLINREILLPKADLLMKLFVFVPLSHAEKVKDAIFNAGGGFIGNYSECSFGVEGIGTFKGEEGTNPFVGEKGKRHEEKEMKVEVIFPAYLKNTIIKAMIEAHPYEEVAHDIICLENDYQQVGSGLIGELEEEVNENDFLKMIKNNFGLSVIKHTALLEKKVKKIAVCGGAGSFLIKNALAAKAGFYLTSDIKYHEFFDAEDKMVIADIGHWEIEQFTPDLIIDILRSNFPTFAVLKSEVNTNPVRYFL